MSLLYAPTIPEIIGAEVKNITIPIMQNSLVKNTDYNKYAIKIKSIQSNQIVVNDFKENINDNIIVSLEDLKIGEFYKVQIAYANISDIKTEIGPYSNVGIIKKTAEPEIINSPTENILEFQGTYTLSKDDPNEKEYYYSFVLKQGDTIKASSGELIHKQDNDNDIYKFENLDQLPLGEYTCEYSIITNNLLKRSQSISFNYNVTEDTNISGFSINYNYEDAYNDIDITNVNSTGLWKKKEGKNWYCINDTKGLQNQRDFDYEQGENYYVGYSTTDESGSTIIHYIKLFSDYEDMFLCDGNRQLAVRYNPQIGSINRIRQDSKTETLGSKFPFFFHTSDVDYNEFSIQGLIATNIDENGLFIPREKELESIRTSTYSKEKVEPWNEGKSIADERKFKLEVLDWLGNGEPKLLKTPYEGNYIVYLSSVSLSPEAGLGRKLHNFSCTADEIYEYNYTNISKLKLDGIKEN